MPSSRSSCLLSGTSQCRHRGRVVSGQERPGAVIEVELSPVRNVPVPSSRSSYLLSGTSRCRHRGRVISGQERPGAVIEVELSPVRNVPVPSSRSSYLRSGTSRCRNRGRVVSCQERPVAVIEVGMREFLDRLAERATICLSHNHGPCSNTAGAARQEKVSFVTALFEHE